MSSRTFTPWLYLCLLAVLPLVGCGSGDSGGSSSDGDDLSVELIIPADGATVSGAAVAVRATVRGGSRIGAAPSKNLTLLPEARREASVEFFIGNTSIQTDSSDPYFFEWNSTTVTNGRHTLRAVATDGGDSASDEISIVVDNEGGGVAVVVDPASVQLAAGQTQQFTADVVGSTNEGVTWSVDGGSINGTITAGGLYTAPASLPANSTATVRATSTASPGTSGTAIVTFQGGNGSVSVSVNPPSATVATGETQQFSATVTGTTNTSVTWEVVGGASNGTISANGLYTAPATVPNPPSITVRATAVADPSASATASVAIESAGGIPQDELDLLTSTYISSWNTKTLIDETNDLVFQSIFFASCSNNNQATITGTITESPPGSGNFQWTPAPADRLILNLGIGQYTVVIDPKTIQGDVGSLDCDDWNSFSLAHTIDYTIQGPPGNIRIVSSKVPQNETDSLVQQAVQGSIILGGETWNISASIEGSNFFLIVVGEFSSSTARWDLTIQGTLQSGSTTIDMNHRQTYSNEFSSSPTGTTSFTTEDNTLGNTGSNGAVNFQLSNIFYNYDQGGDTIVYEGGGSILRNGTAFGTFGVDQSGAAGMVLLSNGAVIPF